MCRLAVALLCLVTLAACGRGGTPSASPSASASAAASGPASNQPATATAVTSDEDPQVSITSPAEAAGIQGSSVTVALNVQHFNIVNKIGGKNADGEGHVHFYLDADEIPTTPGEEATVSGEGRYVATTSTSYTWNDLSPGSHKLGVQLVQNNHMPLEPPVTAEITVTIGG